MRGLLEADPAQEVSQAREGKTVKHGNIPKALVRAVPAQDASSLRRADLILHGDRSIALTISDVRRLLESLEEALEQIEVG